MKFSLNLLTKLLQHLPSFLKWYFLFAILLFAPALLAFGLIRSIALNDTTSSLKEITQRVKHDLRFSEGKWDTSLYNSDPLTAYPNSSSAAPLYIITTDGFVIERSKPISGLLDTSDFKHLMQFETAQDISTVTNEHWRVLSKSIVRDGKTYGVVMVSLYNPDDQAQAENDQILKESIEKIDTVLKITDGQLDASAVDVRNIQYLVSFEIVDKFNKVLVNDGRIPTFIDPSYVSSALTEKSPRLIHDEESRHQHLLYSESIVDSDGSPVAVVVAGESTQAFQNTLRKYLQTACIASLALPIPLSLIAVHFFTRFIKAEIERKRTAAGEKKPPAQIAFDKKLSILTIDDQKIEIVYASNQYYLCKAIFTAPKKRWEQDELIEHLGETNNAERYRKIYDASLAINKKAGTKIIIYQDKTYFFNPEFYSALSSKN